MLFHHLIMFLKVIWKVGRRVYNRTVYYKYITSFGPLIVLYNDN